MKLRRLFALLLVVALFPAARAADGSARPQPGAAHPPGTAIASAHELATQAGFEIIQQGGNAFDAAIAVSATLSVVEPISSGLGGGGFFLLHDGKTGKEVFVDARETAPAAATQDKYLNADGSFTVYFGSEQACGRQPNRLDITEGWNFLMRVYRPQEGVLKRTYKLPEVTVGQR